VEEKVTLGMASTQVAQQQCEGEDPRRFVPDVDANANTDCHSFPNYIVLNLVGAARVARTLG
jgi:hypothetical protein